MRVPSFKRPPFGPRRDAWLARWEALVQHLRSGGVKVDAHAVTRADPRQTLYTADEVLGFVRDSRVELHCPKHGVWWLPKHQPDIGAGCPACLGVA